LKSFLAILSLSLALELNAQLTYEFSYAVGPSATFAKTNKTNNMTWGYSTPLFPNMGIQKLNFNMGSKKIN
jgi:hypothetical protein